MIFFLNLAVHEIVWKNIIVACRPQVTIWHMCIDYTRRVCNPYFFEVCPIPLVFLNYKVI